MFQAITTTKFLEYSFLSKQDPFEFKLRVFVEVALPSIEALVATRKLGSMRFETIKTRPLKALAHIYDDSFAFLLLPPDVVRKYQFFKETSDGAEGLREQKYKLCTLADNVYRFHLQQQNVIWVGNRSARNRDSCYSRAFATAECTFSEIEATLKAYARWKREEHSEDSRCSNERGNAGWTFCSDLKTIELLLKKIRASLPFSISAAPVEFLGRRLGLRHNAKDGCSLV
jgi:hypothetical protein